MNSSPEHPQTTKLRTFIPQLRDIRRVKTKVYEGKLGSIGTTPSSRYRLVAVSAVLSLLAVLGASALGPLFSAIIGAGLVALIAGGWPAATGVAELRGVYRITSHSIIILLTGLASVAITFFQRTDAELSYLPAIAAVGIVASFMAELSRGEGAIGRLESTISSSTGVLASVSVAGWVGLAHIYQVAGNSFALVGVGLLVALILGAFGARIISAGPQEGPRRGAVTLGVTPVAFVGVVGYVTATFLTFMVG